jgi:hypothetical protein
MPWKCPQCGVENADDKKSCEACGHVEFGTLVLTAAETGKEIKINLEMAVGKQLLRTFCGEEARFASDPQFTLNKDAALGGWAIAATSGATNPTFYNGNALPEIATRLEDGGIISIGPEKMKVSVRVVH